MPTSTHPILDDDPDRLLTTEEVRSLLRGEVSDRTLRRWAAKGEGPPVIRIGNARYYRLGDYREWLAARAGGRAADRADAGGAAR
jgi:DNA-binding transcriptional MerR regulator